MNDHKIMLQNEKNEANMNTKNKTVNSPVEGRVALAKAQTYANMCWLGLLMGILVFIFFGMACSKVNEARAYGLNQSDEQHAQKIRLKARNIMLFVITLWILIPLLIAVPALLF